MGTVYEIGSDATSSLSLRREQHAFQAPRPLVWRPNVPTAKIFGLKETLRPIREALSDALHECVVDALKFPRDKRLHRFFLLDREDFYFPERFTNQYTIIEISQFEGRSPETIKELIRQIYDRVPKATGIAKEAIDVTVFETPRYAWGLNGKFGEEPLSYKVTI
jgi:phenylpyruvate tautomerase PptA (4-oxalocrotonate tautomerase family)